MGSTPGPHGYVAFRGYDYEEAPHPDPRRRRREWLIAVAVPMEECCAVCGQSRLHPNH